MRFVMDTHLNVLVFIWRAVIATFKNFGMGQRILPPLFHDFLTLLLVNVRAVVVVGFLRERKIALNKVNVCKLFEPQVYTSRIWATSQRMVPKL